MKVNISIMVESSGNWWVSLFLCTNNYKGAILDTDNTVEIPYGKSVEEAVYKAGELRKKFKTGQVLVDKQELKVLLSQNIFSEDIVDKICESVEFVL